MIIKIFNQIAILATSALCGYGFARIDFPGRVIWFGIALATMLLLYLGPINVCFCSHDITNFASLFHPAALFY